MIKELTKEEAKQYLFTNQELVFWDGEEYNAKGIEFYNNKGRLIGLGVNFKKDFFMCDKAELAYGHTGIEVEPKMRYMTHEEYAAWLVTVGYKNHQLRHKKAHWWKLFELELSDKINDYEYRTVEMIDGKIVYGEPQEFKVKV